MADFALWATACETAFWPPGTFAGAYRANRRAAVEDLIEADPIAARVRRLMASRSTWMGSASDLLRAVSELGGDYFSSGGIGWPKNPRGLAGRLRRAQPFLRTMGVDIAFSREGRAGNRMIKIRTTVENTVSTVSECPLSSHERPSGPQWGPPGSVPADDADDADAADANRQFSL
jgi:hypothetical protein